MQDHDAEKLPHGRTISRRGFLYVAGMSGAAALLAACAAPAAPAPTSAPPTSAPAPTSARAPGTAPTIAAAQLEDQLFIYNWADYTNPDNIKAFEDLTKVKVTQDFYQSNEDALAKIKAGGTGYDIVAPTGYMVKIMGEQDLLLPLDMSKIPNFKYMGPTFAKGRYHDPDNKWSVTKDWGTLGVMWNTEKIPEQVTSWDDFWKLSAKYSGKVAVVDSSPEVIGAALKYLGYSYNSCNKDELDAAFKKLLEIKPHIKAFDSTYFELMATDEVWMSLGWNGDAFNANSKRKAAGKAESIQYVVPKEGSEIWEDDWVILKTAPHPEAAYAWLNFILDPKNNANESNYHFYASGEDEAKKYMNKEVTGNPSVYPADEVTAKLEPALDLAADCLQAREELWTKLKSA